jgi:salicylate hydroxylase
MIRRYGAPFLVIHRGDLQAVLLAAASAHRRITLHTGARLLDATETSNTIRLDLQLASGRDSVDADALIGADGVRSHLRTGRLGGPDAAYSGRMAWRATIPIEAWTGDARVLQATGLWLGSKAHMVHYPIRAGREINVIVAIEEAWTDDGWDTPGNGADLLARLSDWPEHPRRLAGLAAAWRRWALCAVDPDGRWAAGRIALVGDAAHAMLPFAAQGGAMAIEDGAVLARLLATGQGTTADRLAAYVRLRRPRVKAVVDLARRNGTIYHLAGPMAAARDAAMRLMGPRRVLERMDWIWGWRDRA